MDHNVCTYDFLTFKAVLLQKNYKCDTNNNQKEYEFLFPLSIVKSESFLKIILLLSRCFLDFSVDVGAFVIGLNQISSFFLKMFCSETGHLS